MSLTDRNLLEEHPHLAFPISGSQRIYRFSGGFGLSAVNPPELHSRPFAWEVAVLENVTEDGAEFNLTYKTPLTNDVEIFSSDDDTNAFIEKARAFFEDGKEPE